MLEDSRKPDGEAMEQHVNPGYLTSSQLTSPSWASHEESYSFQFKPFKFDNVVIFWRELSLMTFKCNLQLPLITYEPLKRRCLSLYEEGWWRKDS